MSEIISGLLTQKPDSPVPQVGEHKRYSWQQRTGKSGKPWIKVSNVSDQQAAEGIGQMCEVKSIAKTNHTDKYGNVSYNIELFPVFGEINENPSAYQQAKAAMQPQVTPYSEALSQPVTHPPQNPMDTKQRAIIRQHSQSMALKVLEIKQAAGGLAEDDLTPHKLTQLADYFDKDVLGHAQ